jgi:hypothetical protein
METLILTDAGLKDVDLAYLAPLSSLTNLGLAETPITDEGLKFLTGLPIQLLDLSSTGVTDRGILQLTQMATLERIYLHNTSVSTTAVDSLRHQLPHLSVYL